MRKGLHLQFKLAVTEEEKIRATAADLRLIVASFGPYVETLIRIRHACELVEWRERHGLPRGPVRKPLESEVYLEYRELLLFQADLEYFVIPITKALGKNSQQPCDEELSAAYDKLKTELAQVTTMHDVIREELALLQQRPAASDPRVEEALEPVLESCELLDKWFSQMLAR